MMKITMDVDEATALRTYDLLHSIYTGMRPWAALVDYSPLNLVREVAMRAALAEGQGTVLVAHIVGGRLYVGTDPDAPIDVDSPASIHWRLVDECRYPEDIPSMTRRRPTDVWLYHCEIEGFCRLDLEWGVDP